MKLGAVQLLLILAGLLCGGGAIIASMLAEPPRWRLAAALCTAAAISLSAGILVPDKNDIAAIRELTEINGAMRETPRAWTPQSLDPIPPLGDGMRLDGLTNPITGPYWGGGEL